MKTAPFLILSLGIILLTSSNPAFACPNFEGRYESIDDPEVQLLSVQQTDCSHIALSEQRSPSTYVTLREIDGVNHRFVGGRFRGYYRAQFDGNTLVDYVMKWRHSPCAEQTATQQPLCQFVERVYGFDSNGHFYEQTNGLIFENGANVPLVRRFRRL